MEAELRLKFDVDADDSESMERLSETIQMIGDIEGANVDVQPEEEVDEGDEARSLEAVLEELPDEEHRYVFRALIQEAGHSRRVIHREACALDGSPFDDFDPDSETPERSEIGEVLWSLERREYARHDGNLWYPIPEHYTSDAMDW